MTVSSDQQRLGGGVYDPCPCGWCAKKKGVKNEGKSLTAIGDPELGPFGYVPLACKQAYYK